MVRASRIAPPEASLISFKASSGAFIFSFDKIFLSRSAIISLLISLNLKLWHLEIMVGKTLVCSVVAIIKMTCSGGSSMVFRRALKEALLSICTSSKIYILYLSREGVISTLSTIVSLICSTFVWLAASISSTSRDLLSVISLQEAHLLQG